MNNNKIILRAVLKLFFTLTFLSLAYILLAGIFSNPELETNGEYVFDLSELDENSARYFTINKRDVLVIKQPDTYSVFWANDPLYGCRLEYVDTKIKPVCIDLKYDMNGYNKKNSQQLNIPDHKITADDKLIVF